MIVTRKLGKIIRGKTTPFHLYTATLLGALIGFLPSFSAAPGYFFLLLLLLILLNANLFLGGLFILLGALFSELLLPVSFRIGQILLDGPLSSLFALLVNAPVLAWFGLDNYSLVGGIPVALALGFAGGFGARSGLRTLRRKLGSLETGSPKYQEWTGKFWVRTLFWVLFGGIKGKAPMAELADLRKGSVFRPLGLLLAGLTVLLFFVASLFLSDFILTTQTRHALEKANEATVDLGGVELRLREGRLTLRNLALADPEDLHRNRFSATTVEIDLSTNDLLRKRFAFDNIEITGGRANFPRETPGVRIARRAPLPSDEKVEDEELKTLEDYLAEAEIWHERLRKIREILERWERDGDEPMEERDPNWRERVLERAGQTGYANVTASHLRRQNPTLTIHRLKAGDVLFHGMPEERWTLTGHHLSTQPRLLNESPEFRISTDSDRFGVDLNLHGFSQQAGKNALRIVARDIAVGQIRNLLSDPSTFPFSGGQASFHLEGTFSPRNLSLPFETTFRNTTVSVPGVGDRAVEKLRLPLSLEGAMDQPRIRISDEEWARALRDTGQQELQRRGEQLLREQLGGESGGSDPVRGMLDGLRRR
ncbi:MAG: hypothetical protein JJT75_07440 [Opitutales bacterium]|nr:hypothetical protein [Opitutales bacterium]MCH8540951.1 hypothetical protein [Opitutales bacterium]